MSARRRISPPFSYDSITANKLDLYRPGAYVDCSGNRHASAILSYMPWDNLALSLKGKMSDPDWRLI